MVEGSAVCVAPAVGSADPDACADAVAEGEGEAVWVLGCEADQLDCAVAEEEAVSETLAVDDGDAALSEQLPDPMPVAVVNPEGEAVGDPSPDDEPEAEVLESDDPEA